MHNPFELPGSFLKGNLHTHTTNSDGKFTPQQAVDHYREAGYGFLTRLDFGDLGDMKAGGFALRSGVGVKF